MINFTDITKAVEDIFNEANTANKNYTIVRNAQINQDVNKAVLGWIGIYRDNVSYEPYTTGASPYLAEVKLSIEVQAASINSEQDCEYLLDELVDFVMDALKNNRTLKGYVQHMTSIEVDYDDNFESSTTTFWQFATITPTYEVKA